MRFLKLSLVTGRYFQVPLEQGVVDPVQGLKDLQSAYNAAGYQDYLAELQTQIDAFVKGL
jgi:hypothetical protein